MLARNGLRSGVEHGARLRSDGDHDARRCDRPLISVRLDLVFLGRLGGRFVMGCLVVRGGAPLALVSSAKMMRRSLAAPATMATFMDLPWLTLAATKSAMRG